MYINAVGRSSRSSDIVCPISSGTTFMIVKIINIIKKFDIIIITMRNNY